MLKMPFNHHSPLEQISGQGQEQMLGCPPLRDPQPSLEEQRAVVPQIPLVAVQKSCSYASYPTVGASRGRVVGFLVSTALQHWLHLTVCNLFLPLFQDLNDLVRPGDGRCPARVHLSAHTPLLPPLLPPGMVQQGLTNTLSISPCPVDLHSSLLN